jgi:hypothetical protein
MPDCYGYSKTTKWHLNLTARELAVVLSARSAGIRQSGQYLRELLRHDPYRRRWRRYGSERERDVHQVAVAKVLARYLQRDGGDTDYGQLSRRVSRALRGEVLSRETLGLFIAAFEISEEHAGSLWRQWRGAELARVVTGDLPSLSSTANGQAPRFATAALHEFHYLGPDGHPLRHRTLNSIRALQDGLDQYRYGFDTSEVTVDRIGGGTPGRPYRHSGSIWACDIALARTLPAGGEHSLEFEITFRASAAPVEPCFRRVAHERFENVAIRVEFDGGALPRRIWWTEWQDYRDPDPPVRSRQLVTLDAEHAAYHRLDVLDRAAVGFSWEF